MQNNRIQTIVEISLCVALSVVLNYVSIRLPFNIAGGSISLTMLPIAVIALRRGLFAGTAAGTVFGFIDLFMEPYILVPAQVALDYPVPYLLFGLGVGVFAGLYRSGQNSTDRQDGAGTSPRFSFMRSLITVIAVFSGGCLRFFSHVLSGVLFFAEYAGEQNVWLYSLVYNISYLGPSVVATLLCALVLLPILDRAVPVR